MTKAQKPTPRISKTIAVKFKDEMQVSPALRGYFGYCLFKAGARLRLLMDEAMASHKMQCHHFGILRVLTINEVISQIKLGDELGIDKASMVKLIDHLEKNKYVIRQTDKQDRRVKNVQLTEKGIKALAFCDSIKSRIEADFFKNVTSSEQAILKKLIPQLLP